MGFIMQDHEYYMSIALSLAKEAGADGEAPVGCVVVDANGAVIGRGRNRREKAKSALAHAELEAIEDACNTLNDWRLSDCSLYVTLEPCPMCAGAIIMSRISGVFYGAKDELTGSCGSVINLFMEQYGQSTQITGGILAKDCSELLTKFFRTLRNTRTQGDGSGTQGDGSVVLWCD
jgi:tRNA(adenine34) deaminase